MKKHIIMLYLFSSLSVSLLLSGCANIVSPNPSTNGTSPYAGETVLSSRSDEDKNTLAEEHETTSQTAICSLPLQTEYKAVEQGGPYGKLSLSIPAGWHYETCPMDSDSQLHGLYGIRFYPEDAADGHIELSYIDSFGVCGTGLSEETAAIAGNSAVVGIYDNHAYWDFISFRDAYSGIVALTYDVESWWESYGGQVMDILDTLSYDTSIKEGGACIYAPESEADKIGLHFELKKISPSGATLVFHQYDEKAPTGELEYGSAFVLEVQKNNTWEEVPVVVNGDYGFHETAFNIPNRDSTEQELDWEWLYGVLSPGIYRIKKEILDFRAPGDYDKYTVYAQFVLN
ncbi:MAG: hypothetical protein K2N73_17245 [Lachnospiraceae bacterium]|nr:hypothetical protein [Lachnospiraceae bacterium]